MTRFSQGPDTCARSTAYNSLENWEAQNFISFLQVEKQYGSNIKAENLTKICIKLQTYNGIFLENNTKPRNSASQELNWSQQLGGGKDTMLEAL